MSIKLQNGANFALAAAAPGSYTFIIGLDWQSHAQADDEFDIDGSCFLLGSNNTVSGNHDFIFYNQPRSIGNAVCLLDAPSHVGKTGFSVDLAQLPDSVSRVVFCLTLHNAEEKQQRFGQIAWVGLGVINPATQAIIAEYRCENSLDQETAILVGEFYRHNQQWKFKAIGQGYNNGLAVLAESFGVALGENAATEIETHDNADSLGIGKKKRRSPQEVIADQQARMKALIKPILPQIASATSNGANESGTRLVLDKIFQDVLGYTLDEIKTEQKIQGRAADYVLSPDGRDAIVIEAKRAGTPLRQRQIFQATSYAAYSGIPWAILTNLTEWQFYKVSTVDKVDPQLVFTFDLSKGMDEDTAYYLTLISKFGVVRKGLIEKLWLKRVGLKAETLIAALLNDDVITKVRVIICKEMGVSVSNEEVKKAIETEVLKI